MLKTTIEIVKDLRTLNSYLKGEPKIHQWVEEYVERCLLNAKTLTIISPYSISPRLKVRYKKENGFYPTQSEIDLLQKEIPKIYDIFIKRNLKVNWWLYFAPSCLKNTRLDTDTENEYIKMLSELKSESFSKNILELVHLENDILEKVQYPNEQLLNNNFKQVIDQNSFDNEVNRRLAKWVENISKDSIIEDTKYKIACEAEEGRILMQENPLSEAGEFLYMSLNTSDKLKFFSALVPDFEERIVSVLKKYPWRITT